MKKNLLLILITSLSAILSACGADTQSTNANFPKESESGFYEDTLGEKPSFELLQKEITLECGVPFDTDDLSKYIKAENYDNILINIYWTAKTKSSVQRNEFAENHWDSISNRPDVYEVVFSDYTTNYEETMLLTYQDTQAPNITNIGNDTLTYYQLELSGNEMLGQRINKMSEDLYSENINNILLSDGTSISIMFISNLVEFAPNTLTTFKENYLLINNKKFDAYDNMSIIKEFPNPGSYEIEYCITDFGDNTSSVKFIYNVIEDISPEEKESLSEEKYQQLYNDYIAGK